MSKRNAVVFAVCLVLVGALGVFLTGCGIGSPGAGGDIALSFNMAGAKSILPPGSLICTEWDVSGAGPGGATIPVTRVTGPKTFGNLVPGDWTITAVGNNSSHVAIGSSGGVVIPVLIGQTATRTITVQEYDSPNGSFLLDLTWEPSIVMAPVFVGTMVDTASVTTDQVFTTNTVACTSVSNTTELHPGWFADIVRLYDQPIPGTTPEAIASRVLSTGFAEAVRIAAGQQTYQLVPLHAVQGFGTINLNFAWDGMEPLELTPSPAFGDVEVSGNRAFSISADKAATFIWYLRGQEIGVGSNFTLPTAGLYVGEHYRLDVLGFSTDGKHGGSGTWVVTKTAVGLNQIVQGSYYDSTLMATKNVALELVDTVTDTVTASVHLLKTAGPTFNYSFTNVPVGMYWVRGFPCEDGVWTWGTPTANGGSYYYANGTWSNSRATATIITILNPTGLEWTCNFLK